MLTVFGSASIDTIRTSKRTLRTLGGAAVFAAVSASYFARTNVIGVVGGDFPDRYMRMLSRRIDTGGLEKKPGSTFRFDCIYDRTLQNRTTKSVKLGVLDGFEPAVPENYRRSRFVYLANNDPAQNHRVIREFDNMKFSMCDTIDLWINTKRRDVLRMIRSVDALVINDEEARLLTREHNLTRCAKKLRKMGADTVIIKKAEHGAILFMEDSVFSTAGYPVEFPKDPTGAGDTFAGAVMGYMASKNSATPRTIREAVLYGNVMGAFAVQGYGLDGILDLDSSAIKKRMAEYRRITGL